jgi:KaiC/GvpD/RAD55 family RecA-like ATPase/5S rRNA maturation endonuclease (ribonuclease M5)
MVTETTPLPPVTNDGAKTSKRVNSDDTEALCETKQDQQALESELLAAGCKKQGSGWCCGFHEDSRPSGSVYQDDSGHWRFKCHACGFVGDVFDVRAKRTGRLLAEVLKEAQQGADAMSHRPKGLQPAPTTQGGKTLTREQIEKLRPGGMSFKAAYPYGDLFAVRFEGNGDKTFRQFKRVGDDTFAWGAPDGPHPLYRQKTLDGADMLIVVEGEKCADALAALGFVSTTSEGGAKGAERSDWTAAANAGRVILWPDVDEPGTEYMRQVAVKIREIRPDADIRTIDPAGLNLGEKEDAADFIERWRNNAHSDDETRLKLQETFEQARTMQNENKCFDTLANFLSDPANLLPPQVFPTGQSHFDKCLSGGFLAGSLNILSGRTSTGKSTIIRDLAYRIAENVPAAFLTLEDLKATTLQKIVARHGMTTEFGLQVLLDKHVDLHLGFEVSDISNVISSIENLKREYNVNLVLIDQLSWLHDSTADTNSDYAQVSAIVHCLKQTARRLQIAIVLAAQINRGGAYAKTNGGRIELHHLRDSGRIEETADSVFVVQSLIDGVATVDLLKNRNGKRDVTFGLQIDFERWTTTSTGEIQDIDTSGNLSADNTTKAQKEADDKETALNIALEKVWLKAQLRERVIDALKIPGSRYDRIIKPFLAQHPDVGEGEDRTNKKPMFFIGPKGEIENVK